MTRDRADLAQSIRGNWSAVLFGLAGIAGGSGLVWFRDELLTSLKEHPIPLLLGCSVTFCIGVLVGNSLNRREAARIKAEAEADVIRKRADWEHEAKVKADADMDAARKHVNIAENSAALRTPAEARLILRLAREGSAVLDLDDPAVRSLAKLGAIVDCGDSFGYSRPLTRFFTLSMEWQSYLLISRRTLEERAGLDCRSEDQASTGPTS